ncbi:MAG TPA: hypothetical protein VHI95_14800 [Acidimicrobiales bacterium]|nr:hypothetical protein [Acidimicrobiales bacterium]
MKLRFATASASANDRSTEVPAPLRVETSGRVARLIVIAVWFVILALLLRHREVISSDTLSNYVHVWFVAQQVWHGNGLPFHMPVLSHGDALAFPYAFIPWMIAVLLWPLMGEWSVTVVLGAGFVGLVAATFWSFPELRRGWWSVAVLVNPALVAALLLGQLPFLWAASMLMVAVGCWRRDRRKLTIVLAGLAQLTHAAVLVPLTALVVALRYRNEPNRRALVAGWLISLAIALPAVLLVFASPVAAQNSLLYTAWIEVETVALRSLVFVVPMALVAMQRSGWRRTAPMFAAGLMVLIQLVTVPFSGMAAGWSALNRRPSHGVSAFPATTDFVPGATYRVLAWGDAKYGQYSIVRAGGRIDSEFFPESMYRRSFADEATYARFLTRRQIDYVVVDPRYEKFKTNEQELLDDMAWGGSSCVDGVSVRPVETTTAYQLYRVSRDCPG